MSASPTLTIQDYLEIKRRSRRIKQRRGEIGWREWLHRYFPRHTSAPFAERHIRYWEWLSSLQPGVKPPARVEVWPRGGGKSTTTEAGCAYVGSQPEPQKRFVLYVSGTQEQADKHVSAVSSMLLAVGMKPARDTLGRQQGWRLQMIRCANGFSIVSMGIDSAMRGAKLDDQRPDLIIFDDVDERHESEASVKKKIETITESIIPTGSKDVAIVFVQNKIHSGSIVSMLCDDKVDFLHDREPAVVEPAVVGLEWEQRIQDDGRVRYVITAGTATWAGQPLETCESQLNDWGPRAFLREAQHEVDEVEGGIWTRETDIDPFRVQAYPQDMERIVVGVDPNTTGGADSAGIVIAGISHLIYDANLKTFRLTDTEHAYVLEDMTTDGGPKVWAEMAVTAYHKWRADALIAESNNGGEMVRMTIGTIPNAPTVELVWASKGKITRAEPVQKLYADGRVHHVGRFNELEKELCTWRPNARMESPGRLDALVWAITDLMVDAGGDLSDLDDYYRSQGVA